MPALKIEKTKWLKLGIEYFSIIGKQGINVEQMAKKLNCNKSSFYHHFKTKKNFLNEIIQYWYNKSMEPIITEIDSIRDPKLRFERFLILGFRDKSRKDLMFYLRKESETNSNLKQLLNEFKKTRIIYGSQLIQKLGYSESEAIQKAETLYLFYIGWYEINKSSNNDKDIDDGIDLIKTFIKF
ncbi:TetR/AcrR family transcriptional regulator [uncultured Lutibacter sp.]|uniref:TetR/AcrR family transcriptional regulator n=1 Tax=uncultured Lutibacter sp. TaxID=437739 RepID=UPI002608EB81|nr:TetR/AcrR family transcriptional regulator [uncultured Lutibacter sp.]